MLCQQPASASCYDAYNPSEIIWVAGMYDVWQTSDDR